ncbi:terminase TerL endonuclease subunit [Paenisporosarcina macmurdoensis]|uniref:Terminase TerL endonuclease subunit n=1 Tax=Paenisporosarcina macmurdoensis TaxID=212659 RepID=A0ABW1L404_9BACL
MEKTCEFHPFIDDYLHTIERGEIESSKEIKLMVNLVRRKLREPGVRIANVQIDEALRVIHKYFDYELFGWEKFVLAITHCFYEDDTLVFDEFFILMARGNGKNGIISPLTFYFSTHYHGITGYDIEIIANSEEQAITSFNDIYNVLEDHEVKLKKFFYKTKEKIVNRKTKSRIKYYTSNAKTKDSLRSGCLIFDEVHAYENYDLIKVFTSGLGKRKHSRTFYITTNGNVRGGVLDDYLDLSDRILKGEITDSRMLPMLFKLDHKDEVHDKRKWEKANPSIRFMSNLKSEIEKQYIKMPHQPQLAMEFMTKRMNLPAQDAYTAVAEWGKIEATNQLFDLESFKGMSCIGGVDYASVKDFCSVGLQFKKNGKRYWYEHTFICHKALKLENRRINFPVDVAVNKGLITIVNDESIKPEYLSAWFLEQAKHFQIVNIAADSHRASVLQNEFELKGLPLRIVRSGPETHSKLGPLVETMFANEEIVYGDNMTMRWYTNNVFVEMNNKGNITYKKIEPKTRKTDGFFALLHALSIDSEIKEEQPMVFYKAITF